MSAPDPLDRIAARFTTTPTPGLYEFNEDTLVEILALVEVARAARDIESRVVDGPEFNLGEIFNSAGRLAAALARLEGAA